jgi:hypothetical protein
MNYQPPTLDVVATPSLAVIRNGTGCKCALLCRDGDIGQNSSSGAYEIDE